MKNELGLEVCCENCIVKNSMCIGHTSLDCEICQKRGYALFNASIEAYKQRIKELQEQRFTEEELSYLFIALNYYMNAITRNPSNPVPLILNEEAYARIDRLAKKVNLQRTTLKQNK